MRQLAPIRNLIRVKEANASRVMTACAMCYNTLKRANERVKADPAMLERMNNFMTDEPVKYDAGVEVLHTLEVLRELKSRNGGISSLGLSSRNQRPKKNQRRISKLERMEVFLLIFLA